jgi:hypothetical protein
MKIVSYAFVVIFQIIIILQLKLLDNFYLILLIFITFLITGIKMNFFSKSKNVNFKNVGWGVFYGSLTSISLTILFITWLSYNFPK